MSTPLQILIIDDDEDDYFITSELLAEIKDLSSISNWCYNSTDALAQLKSNAYDIYLIDYRLGVRTGLEILKQAISEGCEKPVILLTGKGNDAIDKLAVEYGAYDYLIKGELSSEKLERSMRYALERYRSFKIINDNEKKYRLIFENAASFIFTCNDLLRIENCNAASQTLLGYTPEELKDKSLFDIIAEKDKLHLQQLVSSKTGVKNFNVKLVTKNEDTVLGNLSFSHFELSGQQSYWQGIILDETVRLQKEQANLHNEKLEAIYRLVRTLAHEIRNPLTNISLSASNMEEDNIETQLPFLDIIKRNTVRINSIISDILQSSTTVHLTKKLCNLTDVVKEAIAQAQDRIQLKNVTLTTTFPVYEIVKSIDTEKFKIAILNLMVNAIEAMEGEVKNLEVSITQNLDSTQISIKDSGSGISEENIKNLFEPYFTTKKSGMGLGLIATLNIIKSHNAEIKVESTENIGSTFIVYFQNQ